MEYVSIGGRLLVNTVSLGVHGFEGAMWCLEHRLWVVDGYRPVVDTLLTTPSPWLSELLAGYFLSKRVNSSMAERRAVSRRRRLVV